MKPTSNLKVGMSGDVTQRKDITWTTAVRLMPNRGPLVVGYSAPATRAILERASRAADLNTRRVEAALRRQREAT